MPSDYKFSNIEQTWADKRKCTISDNEYIVRVRAMAIQETCMPHLLHGFFEHVAFAPIGSNRITFNLTKIFGELLLSIQQSLRDQDNGQVFIKKLKTQLFINPVSIFFGSHAYHSDLVHEINALTTLDTETLIRWGYHLIHLMLSVLKSEPESIADDSFLDRLTQDYFLKDNFGIERSSSEKIRKKLIEHRVRGEAFIEAYVTEIKETQTTQGVKEKNLSNQEIRDIIKKKEFASVDFGMDTVFGNILGRYLIKIFSQAFLGADKSMTAQCYIELEAMLLAEPASRFSVAMRNIGARLIREGHLPIFFESVLRTSFWNMLIQKQEHFAGDLFLPILVRNHYIERVIEAKTWEEKRDAFYRLPFGHLPQSIQENLLRNRAFREASFDEENGFLERVNLWMDVKKKPQTLLHILASSPNAFEAIGHFIFFAKPAQLRKWVKDPELWYWLNKEREAAEAEFDEMLRKKETRFWQPKVAVETLPLQERAINIYSLLLFFKLLQVHFVIDDSRHERKEKRADYRSILYQMWKGGSLAERRELSFGLDRHVIPKLSGARYTDVRQELIELSIDLMENFESIREYGHPYKPTNERIKYYTSLGDIVPESQKLGWKRHIIFSEKIMFMYDGFLASLSEDGLFSRDLFNGIDFSSGYVRVLVSDGSEIYCKMFLPATSSPILPLNDRGLAPSAPPKELIGASDDGVGRSSQMPTPSVPLAIPDSKYSGLPASSIPGAFHCNSGRNSHNLYARGIVPPGTSPSGVATGILAMDIQLENEIDENGERMVDAGFGLPIATGQKTIPEATPLDEFRRRKAAAASASLPVPSAPPLPSTRSEVSRRRVADNPLFFTTSKTVAERTQTHTHKKHAIKA